MFQLLSVSLVYTFNTSLTIEQVVHNSVCEGRIQSLPPTHTHQVMLSLTLGSGSSTTVQSAILEVDGGTYRVRARNLGTPPAPALCTYTGRLVYYWVVNDNINSTLHQSSQWESYSKSRNFLTSHIIIVVHVPL